MKTKVFYIEDEIQLGRIVSETLEKQGYQILWESDGSRVLDAVELFTPDIVVLDIMLPGIDGYTLCRQIKNRDAEIPIIFLTAKTETADLVKGFEAGGTDYMRKPFSIEELIVRIENQMRLSKGIQNNEVKENEEIRFGSFIFRPGLYELISPEGVNRLSEKEMQILRLLLNNKNRLTDRRNLLLSVWGDDSFFNTRNLDVYIKKLRNLLSEDKSVEIQTIKGMGHLLIEK